MPYPNDFSAFSIPANYPEAYSELTDPDLIWEYSNRTLNDQNIEKSIAVLTGRRKLDKTSNTLTHYFADGTEAVKFQTLDAHGNPATDAVYEVVPL